MFGDQVTIFQSLQLTVIAMAIVFAVLFVISLIIQGFEHIFPEKKTGNAAKIVSKKQLASIAQIAKMDVTELTNDEEKMIAAFVASIDAAGENQDINYRIVSIKAL